MTTLAVIPELSGSQLAKLSMLRSAWRDTVRALHNLFATPLGYGIVTCMTAELESATNMLIEITGDPDAGNKAAGVYLLLRDYPVPDLIEAYADSTMWSMFFHLVLALQSKRPLGVVTYALALEKYAGYDGRNADWWFKRACIYATLGLPLATRV